MKMSVSKISLNFCRTDAVKTVGAGVKLALSRLSCVSTQNSLPEILGHSLGWHGAYFEGQAALRLTEVHLPLAPKSWIKVYTPTVSQE